MKRVTINISKCPKCGESDEDNFSLNIFTENILLECDSCNNVRSIIEIILTVKK